MPLKDSYKLSNKNLQRAFVLFILILFINRLPAFVEKFQPEVLLLFSV